MNHFDISVYLVRNYKKLGIGIYNLHEIRQVLLSFDDLRENDLKHLIPKIEEIINKKDKDVQNIYNKYRKEIKKIRWFKMNEKELIENLKLKFIWIEICNICTGLAKCNLKGDIDNRL